MLPKLGFIANKNCIRVIKQASVLKQSGYDVFSFTSNPESLSNFKSLSYYDSAKELESTIKTFDKMVDIWTVHNEPSWELTILKEITKKPIVYDMHDSMGWRIKNENLEGYIREDVRWYPEEIALAFSDAVIVVSESCKNELKTRYKGKIVVLPSALPLSEYMYADSRLIGGLVYQGGLAIERGKKETNYRDFSEIFKKVVEKRNTFVYSASFKNEEILNYYTEMGVKTGEFKYCDLIQRLGCHSWNLVGNTNNSTVWGYALPNKFFDALGAGIPSVSFNCPEVEKLIKEHDIGIICKTPEELLERWDEHIEKRINLMKYRREYCLENYIHNLTDLYEELL